MNGFSVTGPPGNDNGPPALPAAREYLATQKLDQSSTVLVVAWQKMRNAFGFTL